MTFVKSICVSRYAATMPPVPKKADWPNDNSPVKPNRMSKPTPNTPQIRIRLTVVGEKPRWGSKNGAAISPIAVGFDDVGALLEHDGPGYSLPAEPSSPYGRSTSTKVIATNNIT